MLSKYIWLWFTYKTVSLNVSFLHQFIWHIIGKLILCLQAPMEVSLLLDIARNRWMWSWICALSLKNWNQNVYEFENEPSAVTFHLPSSSSISEVKCYNPNFLGYDGGHLMVGLWLSRVPNSTLGFSRGVGLPPSFPRACESPFRKKKWEFENRT